MVKVGQLPLPVNPTTQKSQKASETTGKGVKSFSETLKQSIQEVNSLLGEAEKKGEELAAGKTGNLHETMITLEKADLSFRLMMQVRNKIVDAYQEIIKMSV